MSGFFSRRAKSYHVRGSRWPNNIVRVALRILAIHDVWPDISHFDLNLRTPHESDWPHHDMSSHVIKCLRVKLKYIAWHLMTNSKHSYDFKLWDVMIAKKFKNVMKNHQISSKLSSGSCHQMSWNVFQFKVEVLWPIQKVSKNSIVIRYITIP